MPKQKAIRYVPGRPAGKTIRAIINSLNHRLKDKTLSLAKFSKIAAELHYWNDELKAHAIDVLEMKQADKKTEEEST
jgi:hypothetical protein